MNGRRSQHLASGTHVGGCRILRALGEGLNSQVYEARQEGVDRSVALKIQRRADTAHDALEEIQRELEILTRVEHPAIVPLLGAGWWRGRHYLVLAYASGGSLAPRVGVPWPLSAALAVLTPLSDAIDALHASGIVHNDISPQNILLDRADRPWLADFGAAQFGNELSSTASRQLLTGRPDYLAPELLMGVGVSPASDVYSFGVLAYLLLCGALPFGRWRTSDHAPDRSAVDPRRPASLNPLLPENVEGVLLRALAADPSHRPPSASQFIAELGGSLTTRGSPMTGADEEPLEKETKLPLPAEGASREQLQRTTAALMRFGRTLTDTERAALLVLFQRAAASVTRAEIEVQDLCMRAFGPAAALLALDDAGLGPLLAGRQRGLAELATAARLSEPSLRSLFEYLVSRDVLVKRGECYGLAPSLDVVYAPERLDEHPIRRAWTFWAGLSERVGGSRPVTVMDSEDGAIYAGTVETLADWMHAAAAEAAEVLEIGTKRVHLRVLDVGAGSGVWSIAMATRDPGLRITALDRPRVLEVTRKYAAAANVLDRLTCLNGDMHKVRLPRAAFDLVLLANVLHLEPGESIVALLRRLRPALRPRGEVVIVDIIPKRSAAMDEGQHLVSLHLGLRTPRGRIHGGDEYAEWLRAAGFRCRDQYPLRTGRSELALLLAALN